MRDASCAYWFNVGDKVKVTSSVIKAGVDLQGRVGDASKYWRNTMWIQLAQGYNFAVTGKFEGNVDPASGAKFIKGIDTVTHYFDEDELVKVQEHEMKEESAAVDYMSCKAFKLDQLKMGNRRREQLHMKHLSKKARYDPVRISYNQ